MQVFIRSVQTIAGPVSTAPRPGQTHLQCDVNRMPQDQLKQMAAAYPAAND